MLALLHFEAPFLAGASQLWLDEIIEGRSHGEPKHVETFVRGNVKETLLDSVSMRLINSNLGGDPEEYTHKILKLSYSYGADGPHEIVKKEDEWLVLPEPSNVPSPASAPKRITQAALDDAPILMLEYGTRTLPAAQGFRVTNHGAPAFGIQIGDISNGTQLARFGEIPQLTKTDSAYYSIPRVESLEPDRFTAGNFMSAIESDVPIAFSVRYRDYAGNKSCANFKIEKPFFADDPTITFLDLVTPGSTPDVRTPLETRMFQELQSEFALLPWAQKVALKMIYRQIRLHEAALHQQLKNLGFGASADNFTTIINPLRATRFVEVDATEILARTQLDWQWGKKS